MGNFDPNQQMMNGFNPNQQFIGNFQQQNFNPFSNDQFSPNLNQQNQNPFQNNQFQGNQFQQDPHFYQNQQFNNQQYIQNFDTNQNNQFQGNQFQSGQQFYQQNQQFNTQQQMNQQFNNQQQHFDTQQQFYSQQQFNQQPTNFVNQNNNFSQQQVQDQNVQIQVSPQTTSFDNTGGFQQTENQDHHFGKVTHSFYGVENTNEEPMFIRHESFHENDLKGDNFNGQISESFYSNDTQTLQGDTRSYTNLYKIKVNYAKNLIAADINGYSDPFVVVRVNSQQPCKTSVKYKTLSPTWNEEFTFRMLNPKSDRLSIEVFDWDRLKSNDTLGTLHLRLSEIQGIYHGQSVTADYELENIKSGIINLTITAEGMKEQQEKYDKKQFYLIINIDDAKLKEQSKLKSIFTKKKPKAIYFTMDNEKTQSAYFHNDRVFLHIEKLSTLYIKIEGLDSEDAEFKFDLTKIDLKDAKKIDLQLPNNGVVSIILRLIPTQILNVTEKLSFGETNYIEEKLKRVKVSLAKLLNVDVSQIKRVPRIALACSGGGMRSMTATLGYYQALSDMGLLDCICYNSTLSGSTWNIFQWYHQQNKVTDFTKLQTYEIKKADINDPIFLNITSHLKKQFQDGISNGIVYLYGVMLVHSLFKNHIPKGVYLQTSDLIFAPQYVNYEVPYPIFSAITVKRGITCQQWSKWYEFTPHWSGFQEYKGYIDTYLFGCQIDNGELINANPNESAAHVLAIASSAFTETFEYNMKFLAKSKEKKDSVSTYLDSVLGSFKNSRIALSHVNNYMKGMKDNLFEKETELCFADAGLIEGMPALPLLRKERKVDFMIMLDSSSPTKIFSTYEHIEKEKENCYDIRDLPSGFDTAKLKEINEKYQHYILKGNFDEPTCLYMPLKNNPDYKFKSEKMKKVAETGGFPNFGTFKLSYSKEEAVELTSLCEFNLKNALPSLIDEIRKYALGE